MRGGRFVHHRRGDLSREERLAERIGKSQHKPVDRVSPFGMEGAASSGIAGL